MSQILRLLLSSCLFFFLLILSGCVTLPEIKQLSPHEEKELIESLNGAKYAAEVKYKDGSISSERYEIIGNQVSRTTMFDDPKRGLFGSWGTPSYYAIEGRRFFMEYETSFCLGSVYWAKKCGYLGTISKDGIRFEFQADGKTVPRLVAGPCEMYIPRFK